MFAVSLDCCKSIALCFQNELHEDQAKRRKTATSETENYTPQRRSNHIATKSATNHVLTERNNREALKRTSPKKIKRKRSPTPEPVLKESPMSKKRKMITSSEKLYCICQTPYDDTR